MNASILCLMAATAGIPQGAPYQYATVYRPGRGFDSAMQEDDVPPLVVRAQSDARSTTLTIPPTYAPAEGTYVASPQTAYAEPGAFGSQDPYGTTLPPTYQTYQQPFAGGATSDPWLGGGMPAPAPNASPYGAANPGLYTLGFNGAQLYRYGWSARYDYGVLADEGTTSPFGSLGGWGIQEVDTEKELITPIWNNYVFGFAPQFNYRSWEGPGIGGLPGFHGSMFRFGLGLKLATPDYGGWNAEVGFNPAFASDLDNTDLSDAMQWDGHAVAFWRMNPSWMWAFGAEYWDRVDDIVVPLAGAVWTPNDMWEFRLIFPQPRISMYLGTPFAVPTWLYVRGEYHVESYAVELEPGDLADLKIQIEDWRVLAGLRSETGAITTFAEAGWVFERDAKLDVSGLKAQLHSGLIGRVGLRY